jgi:hypothetical protein
MQKDKNEQDKSKSLQEITHKMPKGDFWWGIEDMRRPAIYRASRNESKQSVPSSDTN